MRLRVPLLVLALVLAHARLPAPGARLAAQRVAGAEDVRFARLSVEEGLSNSAVREILQDRRGFLWFGTNNGLNQYDGYRVM
ncbi:MAG: hypothetical protein M3R55_17750, partial [Acidobacteriota bacterium]|nr:hypothetical protein [Acidobacteriota bacterium]